MNSSNSQITDERSELHWAVMYGNYQDVLSLIDAGSDVNTCDEGGWTPLMTAASAGYSHIVNALLEAGARVSCKTKENRTAFFYAVSKCQLKVIDLFLQNGICCWDRDVNGMNPLHRAVCNPKCTVEMLQLLKENEAPFDAKDSNGNLPIHLAAYEGRKDLVEWMDKNTKYGKRYSKNDEGKFPFQLFPSEEFNA